ncbi:hypothetical protein ACFL6X_05405, partial [Candidatus Latescibacterota bacterium]
MARSHAPGMTLHVATDGRDTWSGRHARPRDGDTDGPFCSLERARDEARKISASGQLPPGGVTIEIGGGRYERTAPLELTAADSGSSSSPVVYAAAPGEAVRLLGGSILRGFEPVRDAAILERLVPQAREHVLQIDLKARGLTDFGEASGGGIELFYGDEPMTLARWPNEGFVKIADLVGGDPVDVRGTKGDRTGKFMYEGDRPIRWTEEKDPWVHGYWFWDWSDQRHRVESIDTSSRVIAVQPPYHGYGYRTGQWYYAYNLLAELDSPGEWYLDRETGVLYFWPPGSVDEAEVSVSTVDTLVTMEGVEHLSLRGLS